ncbi:MAG: HlyC/CorC family transporter [Thermoleophilia bacterium]|nr:HlyC/CorC family transporter [Thermoleophilia bacterium]
MSSGLAITLAVVLLAGNAFFVGAEFALISARRSQIEPLAEAGSRRAVVTLGAMENVSLMMACAQLGITACSLGLGAVGEPAVASLLEGPFETAGIPEWLLHPLAFSVALGIVVFLHMVLGEMVPKNIAIAGPERSALALGPPLAAIARILRPVIATLNGVGNAVLRSVGVEPRDEVASAFTVEEVASLAAESRQEGLLDEAEHELVSGALTFAGRTVSSVLVPMGALTVLPIGASPADIQDATARTGFSRFPLAGSDGALAGYLHVKDVLDDDPATRDRPLPPEALRPLATVAAGDSLESALGAMRDRGAHLARVVGAEGEPEGVVTLEDVLEELVGEVRDGAQAARRRP